MIIDDIHGGKYGFLAGLLMAYCDTGGIREALLSFCLWSSLFLLLVLLLPGAKIDSGPGIKEDIGPIVERFSLFTNLGLLLALFPDSTSFKT